MVMAMLIILIVAVVGFSLPSLIRIMTPEKVEDFTVTEVTQLSDLPKAEVKKNEELKPMAPTTPPPPLKSSIKFTAPVTAVVISLSLRSVLPMFRI